MTNFYQVHGSGGEELSCLQVVEGLKQRGHSTLVLTSMHDTSNIPIESDGISRSLYLEMDLVPWRNSLIFFTKRKARERHNLQCLEEVVKKFNPDIIFIWGMWNLPRSLPALAEARYPDKVVYRFASYWPTLPSQNEVYWRKHGRNWYSRFPKKFLGYFALMMLAKEDQQLSLNYKHSICVSAGSRDVLVKAGIPVENAIIIHTGLDVSKYTHSEKQSTDQDGGELNLLYAGRLAPDKGIETAIKTMSKLIFNRGLGDIRLSLVGSGSVDYEYHLRRLVKQEGLENYISFLGWLSPDRMPELMRNYDILLLTSTWAEPFARVLLEGMISGLVVVATPTGGTPEVVIDGENGVLFQPEDPEDLAEKIVRLKEDSGLRSSLTEAGKKTVLERFTTSQMMDKIEKYLLGVSSAGLAGEAGQ